MLLIPTKPGGACLTLVTVSVTGPIGGHCSGDTPAENTVAVCDTISRMPKMSPVRINRDTIRLRPLLLKNERKCYPPKTEDRFCFSDLGSERTEPFPYKRGICDRTSKKDHHTKLCKRLCGRYAQNSAHLRAELIIQF